MLSQRNKKPYGSGSFSTAWPGVKEDETVKFICNDDVEESRRLQTGAVKKLRQLIQNDNKLPIVFLKKAPEKCVGEEKKICPKDEEDVEAHRRYKGMDGEDMVMDDKGIIAKDDSQPTSNEFYWFVERAILYFTAMQTAGGSASHTFGTNDARKCCGEGEMLFQ